MEFRENTVRSFLLPGHHHCMVGACRITHIGQGKLVEQLTSLDDVNTSLWVLLSFLPLLFVHLAQLPAQEGNILYKYHSISPIRLLVKEPWKLKYACLRTVPIFDALTSMDVLQAHSNHELVPIHLSIAPKFELPALHRSYKLVTHADNINPFGPSFVNYMCGMQLRPVTMTGETFVEVGWLGLQ